MNQHKTQEQPKTIPDINLLPNHPLSNIKKTGHRRDKFETNENGEIYFNGYRDYIQELVEIKMDWNKNNIDIETVSYAKACEYYKSFNAALEHSGLDSNELLLIANCRIYSRYNAFAEVSKFFRHLKRFLDETGHVDITICDD